MGDDGDVVSRPLQLFIKENCLFKHIGVVEVVEGVVADRTKRHDPA